MDSLRQENRLLSQSSALYPGYFSQRPEPLLESRNHTLYCPREKRIVKTEEEKNGHQLDFLV